jgi:hypothetical protein
MPGGTVGVVAQDTARFSLFGLTLARLDLPEGWQIMGALNYDCAHASNFLAENFEGDYLLLLGDDHTLAQDLVTRLLAHEREVVAALCLGRRPPFPPTARVDGGPLELEDEPGLIEVDECGTAGMLIHRSVFEALSYPYFKHYDLPDGGYVSDDLYFSRKVRKAGFRIAVDTSLILSHTALVDIEPEYGEFGWQTKLTIGGFGVRVPKEVFATCPR